MNSAINIYPLPAKRIDDFLLYLHDHISDNGAGHTPLFLPISRQDLRIPTGIKDSFINGMSMSLDKLGWRRVWIAMNAHRDIIGHIDLKSHNQAYTHHRAVMGMGVHRAYRKMGLGRMLIESIMKWAKNEAAIDYIDLWVLSDNAPAIRLYKKMGFQQVGEVMDMFRIDDASLDYVMMTRNIY